MRKSRSNLALSALALLVVWVLNPGVGHAAIVSTSGQMEEVDIVVSAFQGGSESNTSIRIFNEIQDQPINVPIHVNFPDTGEVASFADLRPATIIVGRPISSYLIHSDPIGTALRTFQGCATFDEEIIGVIILDQELDDSDDVLGLSSVTYQMDDFRGFEFEGNSFDEMSISSDRFTICVTLKTSTEVDQVRVVTSSEGTNAIRFDDGGGGDNGGDGGDGGGDGFPPGTGQNCDGLESSGIDIIPGNRENIIHLDGLGTSAVGILSTETFDAPNCIDVTSLTFGHDGDEESLVFCGIVDFNFDGLLDIQCDFVTQDTEFQFGDDEGFMEGLTLDGRDFRFSDSVMIIRAQDDRSDDPNQGIFGDGRNCSGLENAKIDIVPGNRDNTIHLDGFEFTPVGLLSNEFFDAPSCILIETLTFGRTGDEESLHYCGVVDVNFDGLKDLKCDFFTELTDFRVGDIEGILRGVSVDNITFTFRDFVTVFDVKRFPSRIWSQDVFRTLMIGNRLMLQNAATGVESISLEVFNLRGELVYESGVVQGRTLQWSLKTSDHKPLANGVYFYRVTVTGKGYKAASSQIFKLAIIR